ncbi:MAG: NAD-dependent DNA ligase LigA [Frisingicoccus sp.]|uniref:NAD-dependent DNA ligase LigA n=1 Tax=Frisingicoccus sp. TaxID=1918627 RepID=UPI002A82BDDB|nr:NAD-dependent DNA ligase LigA [Frisingicoccus sp.]MDY4833998.1 NAD-dependent DNA ligase LigA [Frisingicoccus sp.]
MNDVIREMRELVKELNLASRAYYQESREIMTNYEYDKRYDRLLELEKMTGVTLADSPSIHVGYEVLSDLPKENHESPMLSLDKTKDVQALKSWIGSHTGLLSWKLDGLTIVLTYREGELFKAVTRGNGITGEVITNNAKVFKNIPHRIPYRGELVLRGEAVIKYSDFEKINASIDSVDAKYKNPRNLCSGSVRQLNNEITSKRSVFFFAFTLVKQNPDIETNSRKEQMEWLQSQGFETVEYKIVNKENIEDTVLWFSEHIETNDLPSDGLVLTFDDIAYSRSLGATAKFPRDSIAFKWADETEKTHLLEVEWSASRTGLINPVAIFEPVQLEGTTVSRASIHNVSIVESLQLGLGDELMVYKANMIIPQISENLTRSGTLEIPSLCPVCHQPTKILKVNDVKVLTCPNPECEAKHIKRLTLFVSRDAFNIEGLSEATLEKFVQKGFIQSLEDIFHLDRYKDEIIAMEGMGEKSYTNLIQAIEKSKKIPTARFIYSLGISGVGLSNAKLICRYFKDDIQAIMSASEEDMTAIEGIGPVIARNFEAFFSNEKSRKEADALLGEIQLEKEEISEDSKIFEGKTFVITGSVHHFSNRNALKSLIESKGGKVAGSVSSKTHYLINNDAESTSSKNKKARELGIPILTEDDFLKLLQ